MFFIKSYSPMSIKAFSQFAYYIVLPVAFLIACQTMRTSQSTTLNDKEEGKTETVSPLASKQLTVVETARNYLGTPHHDKNPKKGFSLDCSLLTHKAYKEVGITLPLRSADQALIGKKIKPQEFALGDLVLFAPKKGSKRITHVGLISKIEGDKIWFIHTSTSRGVVEDNFYAEHWQNTFVTARRVL
jgi:cell wall-associated NlpC family hydrolase